MAVLEVFSAETEDRPVVRQRLGADDVPDIGATSAAYVRVREVFRSVCRSCTQMVVGAYRRSLGWQFRPVRSSSVLMSSTITMAGSEPTPMVSAPDVSLRLDHEDGFDAKSTFGISVLATERSACHLNNQGHAVPAACMKGSASAA